MILIEHKFVCDECGASQVQEWRYALGEEAPRPSPPPGWTEFRYQVFCGKHAIHARIGKAIPGACGVIWHHRPNKGPK